MTVGVTKASVAGDLSTFIGNSERSLAAANKAPGPIGIYGDSVGGLPSACCRRGGAACPSREQQLYEQVLSPLGL
jgi:hypothetical protein